MDGFSVLLVLLIAAVTYIQAIHGFISALIMCVLVLICTPLAFTTYEWVAFTMLLGPLGDMALPVAFMGTFAIPLIGLRFAMDALVTRASLIPVLIDRVAAAVLGFVAAYMMAGVLAVGIQMTPLGGQFLGHKFLNADTGEPNTLWMGPDRFAVGYASMMSGGLFSGGDDWLEDHPDLIQELAWTQSVNRDMQHLVAPDSVHKRGVEEREYIFDKTEGIRRGRQNTPSTYAPVGADDGNFWFLVRVKLSSEAVGKDDQHRFARRQIRLVGFDDAQASASSRLPVAINDNEDPSKACRIGDEHLYRPSAAGEVDFVFEVPDEFRPLYIEYKMGSRVDLTNVQLGDENGTARSSSDAGAATRSAPPTAQGSSGSPDRSTSSERADARRGRGDRVSGVRAMRDRAKFSDQLPVAMTDFQQQGLERSGEELANGHVYGNRADQGGSGSGATLTRFKVGSDKRMFQLDVQVLRAGSTLGRALSFSVSTLRNYHLHDQAGNAYPVVGQYAIADVDGVEVVEIQYYPEAVSQSGRGGLRDFRRIKSRHLRGDNYQVAYLFLVQPGAKLTEFTTGRGRRPTDLRPLELVAPG